MKDWQAKAIASIDDAANKMKQEILNSKAEDAYFAGEISGGINYKGSCICFGKPGVTQISDRRFVSIH